MKENWGDIPENDRASACDDCFNAFMAAYKEVEGNA